MEYRNATYNQAGTIDVEIDHADFGWIPFTASLDDPDPLGRELYKEITKDSSVAPYVPPPPARQQVAKSVVQARIIDAGMMGADPDVVGLVQALGLDPAAILAP